MKTVLKIWSEYGIIIIIFFFYYYYYYYFFVFISDIAKTVAWMCYLAWNVETFLLQFHLFISLSPPPPPPPLPFSIGVNLTQATLVWISVRAVTLKD